MKNWKRVASIVLGVVFVANLSACNLVAVDKDKDLAQPVALVNGVEIPKSEFQDYFAQFTSYYQMFGADTTGMETTVLDMLIQTEVRWQKAKEEGLDVLSEEDQAQFDAEFDEYWNETIASFDESAKSELGDEATEEEISKKSKELLDEALSAQDLTQESLKQELLKSQILENQMSKFYESVTVNDDEVKSWYDKELETQKTEISTNPAFFETATPQLVAPEGYFYVKHILIAADEEASTKISELEQERQTVATEMSNYILDDEEANADKIAELRSKNEQLKAQIDEQLLPTKQKGEEVLAKVQAGEDFGKLISEYGEDPGSVDNETGYLIGPESASYDQDFKAGALELKNVGDVSGLVQSSFGYHIIKRVSNVTPGNVPYTDVKDECKENVLAEKQSNEWAAILEEWTNAADITRYTDRLTDNSDKYAD